MSCERLPDEGFEVDSAGRGLVVEALLAEYRNIHQRVLDQVQLYETTNTRILALLGVLFAFGISKFGETADVYVLTIVNAVFVVVVPLISLASVLFTGANLGKIMVWGDFLVTVEDKINLVLERAGKSCGISDGKVMSWELWRVQDGYADGSSHWSIVTFSGMLVVAFFASAVASVIFRLHFIRAQCSAYYSSWVHIAAGMSVLFCSFTVLYVVLYSRKRKVSLEIAKRERSSPNKAGLSVTP